ncbi:MAG: betaine-aldehyde dehydrogenase [Planctomycetota bacterium]|jgi:betaine-aldehyde dehydrogenase
MNTAELKALVDRPWRMLINGELVDSSDARSMETINPANGEVITRFPAATESDVDAAAQAANAAQPDWADTSLMERRDLVLQLADVLREHSAEFGALDSLENGNVYSHMRNDAAGGAYMLDYFCAIVQELKGESTQLDNDLHYTRREPYGVVARLLPFNHPIQTLGAGLAAPLLTGNTLILKPSPHSSLSALAFAERVKDLLPAGVLNIISGSNDCVAAGLLNHPDIPRLAVTGSTEVGKLAMRASAEHLKTTTLELGGKTPMIVFDDADVDLCVDTAMRGMNFKWQGHSCTSTSRVLIHERLHDEFVEKLATAFTTIEPSDPFDDDAQMGPISHRQQFDKVREYIQSGLDEGACLVCGGARVDQPELANGFFLPPTIFAEVYPSMRIAREEIYGPVISIIKWRSEDEAIAIANSVDYGLAAVIMSNNIDRVHRSARRLQAGFVEVNGPVSFALGSPFGGTKASGSGREGNLEELISYTQLKSVNVRLGHSI